MTMPRLIIINMLWNALFIAMAASEMIGLTAVHEGKWGWITALAGGNLVIHVLQLRYFWNALQYALQSRR